MYVENTEGLTHVATSVRIEEASQKSLPLRFLSVAPSTVAVNMTITFEAKPQAPWDSAQWRHSFASPMLLYLPGVCCVPHCRFCRIPQQRQLVLSITGIAFMGACKPGGLTGEQVSNTKDETCTLRAEPNRANKNLRHETGWTLRPRDHETTGRKLATDMYVHGWWYIICNFK